VALALAKHPLVSKYDLSSVIEILCGAAPLGSDLENALRERLKHINVKQAYGMTELSPVSHMVHGKSTPAGSVGFLVPAMDAKIVDIVTGETLPADKEGEICVRGPNVMKGYLNKPEATSQMIDDDGFLHTGDVGYVDDKNYYYIVDRVKELIKYKAYQVPPAELEGLLLSHPKIADAAVIGIPDEEAGELPKAFIVLKPEQQLSANEIIEFIEKKVAPYKRLRGGAEFINAIPKSPSGKILRRLLRQQEKERTMKQKV